MFQNEFDTSMVIEKADNGWVIYLTHCKATKPKMFVASSSVVLGELVSKLAEEVKRDGPIQKQKT